MRPTTLTLGTRQVGEGQPCFVLAEVASAHGGSADVALRMLESAFKMGADGIKFQLFRSDLLVVARHPGATFQVVPRFITPSRSLLIRLPRPETRRRRAGPRL